MNQKKKKKRGKREREKRKKKKEKQPPNQSRTPLQIHRGNLASFVEKGKGRTKQERRRSKATNAMASLCQVGVIELLIRDTLHLSLNDTRVEFKHTRTGLL